MRQILILTKLRPAFAFVFIVVVFLFFKFWWCSGRHTWLFYMQFGIIKTFCLSRKLQNLAEKMYWLWDACFVFLCKISSKHFPVRLIFNNYSWDTPAQERVVRLHLKLSLDLSDLLEVLHVWTVFRNISCIPAVLELLCAFGRANWANLVGVPWGCERSWRRREF
jgi:hypothetical protein